MIKIFPELVPASEEGYSRGKLIGLTFLRFAEDAGKGKVSFI